jgi:hypothetical protein
MVASEDEWYKAAYYNPDKYGEGIAGYGNYLTQTDTPPDNHTQANYWNGGYSFPFPY